jgi:hypothetical protein
VEGSWERPFAAGERERCYLAAMGADGPTQFGGPKTALASPGRPPQAYFGHHNPADFAIKVSCFQ